MFEVLRCYAMGTTSGTRWERGYCSSDFFCRNLQRGEALRAVWVTRCSSVNRCRWVLVFERGESFWCIQRRLILTAEIIRIADLKSPSSSLLATIDTKNLSGSYLLSLGLRFDVDSSSAFIE